LISDCPRGCRKASPPCPLNPPDRLNVRAHCHRGTARSAAAVSKGCERWRHRSYRAGHAFCSGDTNLLRQRGITITIPPRAPTFLEATQTSRFFLLIPPLWRQSGATANVRALDRAEPSTQILPSQGAHQLIDTDLAVGRRALYVIGNAHGRFAAQEFQSQTTENLRISTAQRLLG
jgi:hypothetical protein